MNTDFASVQRKRSRRKETKGVKRIIFEFINMTDKINRPTGYGMTAEVKKKVGRNRSRANDLWIRVERGFERTAKVALLSLSFASRFGRTRYPCHEFPQSRSKVAVVTLKRV